MILQDLNQLLRVVRILIQLMMGIGKVRVKQPRVRDKRPPEQREFFTSAVLPKYLRKTKSMEELIPWLYLKGISTNDFPEALQALLGTDAKGLSASTITRLKSVWEDEYADWSKRSMSENITFICGPMASTATFGWKTTGSACSY